MVRGIQVAVLSALMALLIISPLPGAGQEAEQKLTESQITGVLQAVLDEIYDGGYQKEFWGFETSGPRGPEARFKVYFRPNLVSVSTCQGCREGVLIYKFLPFGEILRPFILDAAGKVSLVGSPKRGFSWNRPASPTIYMDDDDVIKDKQQWIKAWLSIELKPSKDRITEAAQRQKERIGFSQWEEDHSHMRH